MADLKVNNITNYDGTTGPSVAGIPVVDSNSHFVVPTGRTGQRYADGGDNIVRDGLVLYLDAKYSYPGASGTNPDTYTWYDLSGNENNGELINGVSYSGTDGGSLVFDGVDDYGLSSTNLNFSSNAPITISFWFKTNLLTLDGPYYRRLFHFTNNYSISTNTTSVGWYTAGANLVTSVTVSTGVWYKVDNVYTGSQYQTYVNGVLGNSFSALLPSISSQLWIGRYHLSNDGRFNGNISQVSIYNRALSASEIQQNFNATRSRYGI